jgi:hypothetical protein
VAGCTGEKIGIITRLDYVNVHTISSGEIGVMKRTSSGYFTHAERHPLHSLLLDIRHYS